MGCLSSFIHTRNVPALKLAMIWELWSELTELFYCVVFTFTKDGLVLWHVLIVWSNRRLISTWLQISICTKWLSDDYCVVFTFRQGGFLWQWRQKSTRKSTLSVKITSFRVAWSSINLYRMFMWHWHLHDIHLCVDNLCTLVKKNNTTKLFIYHLSFPLQNFRCADVKIWIDHRCNISCISIGRIK